MRRAMRAGTSPIQFNHAVSGTFVIGAAQCGHGTRPASVVAANAACPEAVTTNPAPADPSADPSDPAPAPVSGPTGPAAPSRSSAPFGPLSPIAPAVSIGVAAVGSVGQSWVWGKFG